MNELIAANELVEKARKEGVNLGKGNPLNRLRYYTKIGWLPHMERKQGTQKNVVGHFPTWAFERLRLIDSLKKQGFSNEEITSKLNSHDARNNLKTFINFLKSPEKKLQTTLYIIVFLLVLIALGEFGVIGASQNDRLNAISKTTDFSQILDSGVGIIPKNSDFIIIESEYVSPTAKIQVTFEDDYSPAKSYWIDNKLSFTSFTVKLDTRVRSDTKFSWWVAN